MPAITTSLWFDNNLEEAAEFLPSVFPNSSIEELHRGSAPGRGTGATYCTGASSCWTARRFLGFNGGPTFQFFEAVSFMIGCKDQDKVDYCWDRLVEGRRGIAVRMAQRPLRAQLAGHPGPVVRAAESEPARAAAATKAMMGMRKIVIAELEEAVANA